MKLFRWLVTAALALCFCVVVFGAFVRLSDAGLGCPDWPTCYGHLGVPSTAEHVQQAEAAYPGRPVEHAKAWKEMIHRYGASTLGLLILGLALLSFREGLPKALPRVLLLLVIGQGVLGMWTVTWLLKPLVVTAHLLGGMTTLALLCWLWLDTRPDPAQASEDAPATPEREYRNERQAWAAISATPQDEASAAPTGVRIAAGFALALLAGQIFLGGWTSTHYAALACPDLPTCQGQLWPELHLKEAFTDHGVLDNPTRMTIHQLHRVGAFVVMIGFTLLGLWLRTLPRFRRYGQAILALLALQLTLGVTLVLAHLPLLVAAAHSAGAALLLLAVITLNHAAYQKP